MITSAATAQPDDLGTLIADNQKPDVATDALTVSGLTTNDPETCPSVHNLDIIAPYVFLHGPETNVEILTQLSDDELDTLEAKLYNLAETNGSLAQDLLKQLYTPDNDISELKDAIDNDKTYLHPLATRYFELHPDLQAAIYEHLSPQTTTASSSEGRSQNDTLSIFTLRDLHRGLSNQIVSQVNDSRDIEYIELRNAKDDRELGETEIEQRMEIERTYNAQKARALTTLNQLLDPRYYNTSIKKILSGVFSRRDTLEKTLLDTLKKTTPSREAYINIFQTAHDNIPTKVESLKKSISIYMDNIKENNQPKCLIESSPIESSPEVGTDQTANELNGKGRDGNKVVAAPTTMRLD